MRRTLLLLVALSLAVAGPTLAQKATSPEKTEKEKPAENAATMSGTVVSISDSELVLKTNDGDRRFSVDDRTEVPPDLGPNAHVKVTFQKTAEGLHAKRVAEGPLSRVAAGPGFPRSAAPPPVAVPLLRARSRVTRSSAGPEGQ